MSAPPTTIMPAMPTHSVRILPSDAWISGPGGSEICWLMSLFLSDSLSGHYSGSFGSDPSKSHLDHPETTMSSPSIISINYILRHGQGAKPLLCFFLGIFIVVFNHCHLVCFYSFKYQFSFPQNFVLFTFSTTCIPGITCGLEIEALC